MTAEEQAARIFEAWYERHEEGTAEEPDALLAAHPELGELLRPRLQAMGLLDGLRALPGDLPEGTPERIGDYRILREIGRGGMGAVYEAEELTMRRRVALKVLSLALTSTAQAGKRFQREAQAGGRLHHTNIVPIYGMGQHGAHWYYAMELVRGSALSDVIRDLRRQSGTEGEEESAAPYASTTHVLGTDTQQHAFYVRAAEMFASVAEALHLAHTEGVIHRDVKPANLLLEADGTLKIVDFGLAYVTDPTVPSMTMTGDLLGTPHYMSPEQAMAKRVRVDHRTDVYSLGATMYEVLTLRQPFQASSLPDLCSQILSKDPVLPSRVNARVPRDLETIVLKAMEKDRDRRYASAAELARDLRRFATGANVRARRVGLPERAWRRVKRHPVRSGLITALGLALIVAVLLGLDARSSRRAAALEADARREMSYENLVRQGEEALRQSRVRLREGRSDSYSDRFEEAERFFSEAIALMPDRPRAWWLRAFTSGGAIERRLADLEKARAAGLAERTYHMTRARLLQTAGRDEESARAQASGQAAPPGGPEDALLEALLLESRDPAGAVALLDGILDEGDLSPGVRRLALRNRALTLIGQGPDKRVIGDLMALQALGEEEPWLFITLARAWVENGDPQAANGVVQDSFAWAREGGDPSRWIRLWDELVLADEIEWNDQLTQEALRLYPDHLATRRARAVTLMQLDRHAEGLALAEEALQDHPEELGLLAAKGFLLWSLARYEEARIVRQRIVELDPENPQRRYDLALALNELGRNELALIELRKGERLAPARPDIQNLLCAVLHQLGRNEDALAAAQRALQLDPDLVAAYDNGASALLGLGRAEEALAWSDKSLAAHPDDSTALGNRMAILLALGRRDDALETSRRAIETATSPLRRAQHLRNRAIFLKSMGRPQEALAAIDEVLELRNEDAIAHAERGAILGALGRHPEALTALDRSLEIEETLSALAYKARVMWHLRRFPEARALFERIVELDPDGEHGRSPVVGQDNRTTTWALLGLAAIHQDVRKAPAEALAALDAYVRLEEGAAAMHCERGWLLRELDRPKEALAALTKAIELDDQIALAWIRRGAVRHDALHRHADALADFDRALDLENEDARRCHSWAHHNRGMALRSLRRYDEALAAFAEALTLDPAYVSARMGRVTLLQAQHRMADALAELDRLPPERRDIPATLIVRALLLAELGLAEESEDVLRRAREPEPEFLELQPQLLYLHRLAGDHEAALVDARALASEYPSTHGFLEVIALRALGRSDEARRRAQALLEEERPPTMALSTAYLAAAAEDASRARRALASWDLPPQPDDLHLQARILTVLGDEDAAITALEEATKLGFRRPPAAAADPDFTALEDDERFQKLRAEWQQQ